VEDEGAVELDIDVDVDVENVLPNEGPAVPGWEGSDMDLVRGSLS
jgi:hypothetical protein